MSILITGATGFIGKHLFLQLNELGYNVTGLSLRGGIINNEKIFSVDLKNRQEVNTFFQDHAFDIIIHMAAHIPNSTNNSTDKNYLIHNLLSTYNLLNEFGQSNTQKFIFSSSISVFGTYNIGYVDEKTEINAETFYSAGKYCEEVIINQYGLHTKKVTTILRIPSPYGPGLNTQAVIPTFIKLALNSKDISIYGSGERSQNFIYITDVVNAFLAAVQKNCPGSFNIGSAQSTSTKNLAEIILSSIPNTNSKIIFTGNPDPHEYYRLKINIEKAKRELPFFPQVSIKEGIKRYSDYLKKTN